MIAYADTSFLGSLYLNDAHTREAERTVHRLRPVMILTTLHEMELTNAIQLLVFRKLITAAQAAAAHRKFQENLAVLGPLRPVPHEVFGRAADLARRHTARYGAGSLDVLHVAAALSLGAERFLTFDRRQRKLARAEGLRGGR